MKIKILIKSVLTSCLIFLAVGVFATKAAASPRIYFDPASKTVSQNSDFQINLIIDAEANSVFGADAKVSFPAGVTVKSVTNGGFFTDFSFAQGTGQLEIHGYFSTLYQTKNGSGTFATITFNSSSSSGSENATFVCTGSGSDTEILSSDGQNILSCSSLNQLALTYTGTSTNPTDSPSSNGPTNECGGTCGSNYNCNSGLFCYQGYCRNPSCQTASDCNCPTAAPTTKPTVKPTVKPGVKPTPEVVTLAETTPIPSLPTRESPPEISNQEKIAIKPLLIWIGGGILGLLIIFILIKIFRKKGPGNMTPPTTTPPQTDGGENIETYTVNPPFGSPPNQPPMP